jgi:hypothetical protein
MFSLFFLSALETYSQHVSFVRHIIYHQLEGAFDCVIADIDDDGDNDIAAVATDNNIVGWWENDGSGNFTTHIISTTYEGAISVFAYDLDSDADMDILTAAFYGNEVGWWENDGSQNFTYHLIADSMYWARCIHSTDLDQDGDNDVLIAVQTLDLIAWFENDGNENFTQHNISTNLEAPYFVNTADMDDDSDIDVLSAHYDDGLIVVWENDGSQNFTQHIIADQFNGTWVVYPMDLDADDDFDLLSCARSRNLIAWAENLGGMSFVCHSTYCSPALNGPWDICAVDFDLDQDLDLACTAFFSNNIGFWQNDGNQNFHLAATLGCSDAPIRIRSGDLDGDSDYDIAYVANGGSTLEWWENTFIDTVSNDNADNALSVFPSALQPSAFSFSTTPNPFNSTTTLTFELPSAGEVSIIIYDVQGREISKFEIRNSKPGTNQVNWNAEGLPSGIYLACLKTQAENQVQKLLLIK